MSLFINNIFNLKNNNSTSSFDKIEKYTKNKAEIEKFLKQVRTRASKRSNLFGEDNKGVISEELNRVMKGKEVPGPGYYEINQSFNKNDVPQQFQYFGSLAERFPHESSKEENKLGPGLYFRDDTFIRSPKKTQKKIVPFGSKTRRDEISGNNIQECPGPGAYDNVNDISPKKSFSKNKIFNSSENRFPDDNHKVINPGPGAYLAENDNRTKLTYKFSSSFKGIARLKNKNKEVEKEEENYPSIGQYKTDIINSMNYNVQRKINKPSMIFAPFNSLKKIDLIKRCHKIT